jgi:transcriptional regulator with XRE-family HTH domain
MLRQARLDAGFTQRDVATRLSKPPSFPHKVETGERELNVIELMDYCTALNIDFTQFAREIYAAIDTFRNSTSQRRS